MGKSIEEGNSVRTLADLPVGSAVDRQVIPAGSNGTVRRVYTDALGGYQVEFRLNDNVTSAIVYANQLVVATGPTEKPDNDQPQPEGEQHEEKPSDQATALPDSDTPRLTTNPTVERSPDRGRTGSGARR